MLGNLRKIKVDDIAVVEALAEADLEACLKDTSENERFILYTLNNRQSLLRVNQDSHDAGKMTVLFYDLLGRPMTQDVKAIVEKILPDARMRDIGREERMEALLSPNGFGANQSHLNLEQAVEKLAQIKLGRAEEFAHATRSKQGFFENKQAATTVSNASLPQINRKR